MVGKVVMFEMFIVVIVIKGEIGNRVIVVIVGLLGVGKLIFVE